VTHILVSVVALVALGGAAAPRQETLITFDALQQTLDAPGLRLLDARPRADYDKGHLPGAVWVDLKAAEALKPGPDTDRAAWSAWVAPLGLGAETTAYVYDADRQRAAARVWWLLRYAGVERVGLVNGGFPLWAAQGRPVSTETPRVAASDVSVRFRNDRVATRDDVLGVLKSKSARVVDARSAGEYAGTEKRARRAGHVPEACHLEWLTLVDKDGRFLDEPALRQAVAAAGVRPGEPLVVHCQSGGRASVDAFVFERLGFPTRNFYAGWSDWGNATDTPVAVGAPGN
jgi:thiosulfate/3-mercaptopyruvate sulfurtransferase